MKLFKKTVIIGTGLIGGSLGLALKEKHLVSQITGLSRHKRNTSLAKKAGAIDYAGVSLDVVKDADLIILATPVEAIIEIALKIAKKIKKDCVVIDVGNPHILVIADLLKVDEIYRVGGAQGIAALAYGTKTVPRVDKIVGPGNIYVSEAKRQVFGLVDIDMIAGPTELVIIANRFSDPKFIVADLRAQAEHAKGLAILITNSKSLAKEVKSQLDGDNGYIILTKNLKQACEISNKIAPEHLEILVQNPKGLLKNIKNAGAIFLGPYSPTAVGDYVAGPSHVLPTNGTARFFSGLSVFDFVKSCHIISYSKKSLEKMREPLEKIAGIEGLQKHVDSVRARF